MSRVVGLGVLGVALMALALTWHTAHGQGPLVFAIQPARGSLDDATRGAYFTYSLTPGAAIDDAVAITNSSDTAIRLKFYAADAITAINGGTSFAGAAERPTDVGSWLSAGITEVQLPPHQQLTVPFSMRVPAGATPGDHIAGWVVEAGPSGAAIQGLGANVTERAGVAVVVSVPGPTQEKLALGSMCLNQETGSDYFEVPVENQGNVITRGSGAFRLATEDGSEVFTRPVELGAILPQDRTSLRIDSPRDPGAGSYVAELTLSQINGQETRTVSNIKVGKEKANGCLASAVAAEEKPGGGIPYFPSPPGGSTPWLILILLIALLFALMALREFVIRRRLKADR